MNKSYSCCKFGYETKSGGQKPSPGHGLVRKTFPPDDEAEEDALYCTLKQGVRHCVECKKAKITTFSGAAPQPGNIWCDKKKTVIHKMHIPNYFE